MVNPCKSKLEKGILLPDGSTWQSQAWALKTARSLEAHEMVPIKERFLVEVSAAGGGWLEATPSAPNPCVEVPAGRFRLRPVGGSRAQLEALKGKMRKKWAQRRPCGSVGVLVAVQL